MTSSAQLALDGTHPMYETEQGIENRRWQGCARGLTDDKRRWNQWQLVTESPMAAALSSCIGESFCWGGAKEVGEAAEDVARARREPAAQPRRGGAGSRQGSAGAGGAGSCRGSTGAGSAGRRRAGTGASSAGRSRGGAGAGGAGSRRSGTGAGGAEPRRDCSWPVRHGEEQREKLETDSSSHDLSGAGGQKEKNPTEGGGTGEEQKNRTGWGRRSVRSGRELVGSGAEYY